MKIKDKLIRKLKRILQEQEKAQSKININKRKILKNLSVEQLKEFFDDEEQDLYFLKKEIEDNQL